MNLYDEIQEHFRKGGNILIATHLRATKYQPKHAAMFRAPRKKNEQEHGVYVQRGKHWDYANRQWLAVRFL